MSRPSTQTSSATFVIGLDYGTASARGVLIDAGNGKLIARESADYAHGTYDTVGPDGSRLPSDWALQDGDDWLRAAEKILSALALAIPSGGTVAGIGIDATASTPLPTFADGTPLSRRFPTAPHAFAKLWKHHGAQPWADRIEDLAPSCLARTGGRTSCEWLPSKAGEIAGRAPEIWDATERFIECGDWLVWQFTGEERRSVCQAGYKAHWTDDGYPDILDTIAPGLSDRLAPPLPVGTAAGTMTPEWVARTGLPNAPTVAVATIDAHAAVPAVGVSETGTLVGSLGTSSCYLLMADRLELAPGIAGAVKDGIMPGSWGYESGQAAFGDILSWFVRSFCAGEAPAAAFERLNAEAAGIRPAGTGLLTLDWHNGCRTPLVDPALSGSVIGLTLQTRPVDLYRALMEGICLGARRIVEVLENSGLPVHRLVITSGLAEKNPLLLTILTDIMNRPVAVPDAPEATARGAAIHGAVAGGCYADFPSAVAALGRRSGRSLEPDPEAAARYETLYGLYRQEADAKGGSDMMRQLRHFRE